MFGLPFAEHENWKLLFSAVVLFISLFYFAKGSYTTAITLLTISAFGIRIVMAGIDPYLHEWDERFHMLVARNMLSHPFKPMLISDPAFWYNYQEWDGNHIWLHKQPLSLWEIALSFKLFGISPFKARIPMAIMSTLLVPVIYRMGSISISRRTGYLAAVLFTISYYALQFVSGYEVSEHPDMSLFFYVTLSLWAWMEYKLDGNKKWLIAIGIFSGLAVLSKWLVGLMVYAGWGLTLLASFKPREFISQLKPLLFCLLISVVIFLPWQIYTFIRFPVEAAFEWQYNRMHIFKAIEGHSGGAWYYIDGLVTNYGHLAPLAIIPGIILLFRRITQLTYRVFLIGILIGTYLFFTVSATKMPAFAFVAFSIVFLAFGCLLDEIMTRIQVLSRFRWPAWLTAIILFLFIVTCLNPDRMVQDHTYNEDNPYWSRMKALDEKVRKVSESLHGDYLFLGVPYDKRIDLMFYSGGTAYQFYPSKEDYLRLKTEGRKMAAFVSPDLPDYLRNDPQVVKINGWGD